MTRVETVHPTGRGDTKERSKTVLAGAALGAARGAYSEVRRQRKALIDEGVGNIPPTDGRLAAVRRKLAQEAAIARQIGLIDVGRAALIGAGQGVAVAGVVEAGSHLPKSTRKSTSRT